MNEKLKRIADLCYEKHDLLGTYEFNKEKFAELIVRDYARQLVQSNMSNPEYARAMDEHYEQKWAHRFD